jgi:hypothetical protein
MGGGGGGGGGGVREEREDGGAHVLVDERVVPRISSRKHRESSYQAPRAVVSQQSRV